MAFDADNSIVGIHGSVSPGFEPVRAAFEENFARRHELGGAVCIYHQGKKVVDLWGGSRDKVTEEPWEEDTMVIVYSASKGLAAMTLALAHSRGWLDYDERVATYWPEFAQYGKGTITVRQLLAHQAGLHAFEEKVTRDDVADLDRLAQIMARAKPAWPPGTHQAYHGITLGFYQAELLRRVDPKHRTLGHFFQDEIATPLGLEAYIRIPDSIPRARFARLARPNPLELLRHFPLPVSMASMSQHSNLYKALMVNPGAAITHDAWTVYPRNFEVPSGGGVASARGLSGAYNAFATNGAQLHLKSETLQALADDARPAKHGFFDLCLLSELKYSLGFMKPSREWPFAATHRAFGSAGTGGAFAFADPDTAVAYGYVTSQMGAVINGDPRDVALRKALDAVIRERFAA